MNDEDLKEYIGEYECQFCHDTGIAAELRDKTIYCFACDKHLNEIMNS